MSVRFGVTMAEEKALTKAINDGMSWGDIVAQGSREGEKPILTDVDLAYVKENFYIPMKQAADAQALAKDLADKATPK
jgi:hypothetical protein